MTLENRKRVLKLLWAILLAGLVAGTLDIISAFASSVPTGSTVAGILQYVASGAIGLAAFKGGFATAAVGIGV